MRTHSKKKIPLLGLEGLLLNIDIYEDRLVKMERSAVKYE
jgi:hypothetical protein